MCLDFPPEWNGMRFVDYWTEQNSGGTPLKKSQAAYDNWAKNPQYVMEIKRRNGGETELFLSLGQPDGRLVPGLVYPFEEAIHPVVFGVFKLDEGKNTLDSFDPKKLVKNGLSTLKEYREISLRQKLPNGRYVVVPSTKKAGQYGKFYLNIYYGADDEEVLLSMANGATEAQVIAEEEEEVGKYDENFKKVLKLK